MELSSITMGAVTFPSLPPLSFASFQDVVVFLTAKKRSSFGVASTADLAPSRGVLCKFSVLLADVCVAGGATSCGFVTSFCGVAVFTGVVNTGAGETSVGVMRRFSTAWHVVVGGASLAGEVDVEVTSDGSVEIDRSAEEEAALVAERGTVERSSG